MKTLYLECNMGAAGDMLMAALLELIEDKQGFIDRMNELGIPGVKVIASPSVKCGIQGTHVSVIVNGEEEESFDIEHEHDPENSDEHTNEHLHEHKDYYNSEYHHEHAHGHVHEHNHTHEHGHHKHEHNQDHKHEHEHHHTRLYDIEHIVSHLDLPEKVKKDVMAVYNLIAEAESHAHGKPVTEIHFHEVGTMDAVTDIVGVCLLMNEIAPDYVVASPIHVGYGKVRCSHGILPVPAPATAYILQGVPIYGGAIRGELCTPTGAALLKHFADSFGPMPVMKVSRIGYGMGKKDFEAANCVRAMLGETNGNNNVVAELCCNLDDMTPEAIGFAIESLFEAGALEVYTVPIGMKKSRPGILLCVMCKVKDKDKMIHLIFKHTTTLGIRENISQRYTLNRTISTLETPYGPVRQKISEGYGVRKSKYEFDDISRIAKENNLSLTEVIKFIEEA